MSERTKIAWTDSTWNPVRGCTKVSPGCANCYAEAFAERFRGVPGHPFENGFDFRLVPEKLDEPLRWKKPRMVFVCSMGDLFHEEVSEDYIKAVFDVMAKAHWHVFQVLTKRSPRLLEMCDRVQWAPNIWMGVSVESQPYVSRIKHLAQVPSAIRFISVEPLLGSLPDLQLSAIDWVIVGGESGSRARPMELSWAQSIRDQCVHAGVPFFLKQLGGRQRKHSGEEAVLDGQTWVELPAPTSNARYTFPLARADA